MLMQFALCFSLWAQSATEFKEIKFNGSDKTLLKAVLELQQSLGDNNFQGYLNVLFNLETDREPFFREYAKLTGQDPYREYRQNGTEEFMKKAFSRQPFNSDNLRSGFNKLNREMEISPDFRLLLVEDAVSLNELEKIPAAIYRTVRVYFLRQGKAQWVQQAFVRVAGRWKFFKAASPENCGIEDIDKMIAVGIYSPLPMELNGLKLHITMGRMKSLGIALDSYITDNARVPECADGDWECLQKALTPFYAKELAVNDAWGNPLRFIFAGENIEDNKDLYVIVSGGADGVMNLDTQEILNNPEYGGSQFEINSELDYNHDVAYANGQFVVAPVVKKR